MKIIAPIISYLFHPLFMLILGALFMMSANPYLFGTNSIKTLVPLIALITFSTAIIPGIGLIMMKLLGQVKSIELETRQERVGPLFLTAVIYGAFYFNISQANALPSMFVQYSGGSMISLFLALFINSFNKISLHAIGISGLLTMLIINYTQGFLETFKIILGQFQYEIHFLPIIISGIIIAGIIGTARIYTGAHNKQEIWIGFFVGILGQIMSTLFF